MKKQTRKVLLGAATVAAIAGMTGHQAVAATTDDVQISAIIIAAIDVTATATLNFGSISLTGVGGWDVTVPAAGAATFNGPLTLVAGQAPGGFRITGVPGISFEVTAPATVQITNTAAATQLNVNDFVFGAANQAGSLTDTLTGANTTAVYAIGGTLDIPIGTQPGTYQGSVTLTAAYN